MADLYAERFHQALAPQSIQSLYRITTGWVMGAILIAHTIDAQSANTIDQQVHKLTCLKRNALLDYFRGEILSGLSDQLRQAIYSLAWLEKIPAELAEAMGYARESLEAGALAPHLICAVNI